MRIITLTRGLEAIVDDEDYALATGFGKWQALKGKDTWYAVINKRGHALLLHRLVMGIGHESGKYKRIDHIDFNGLNCQKINLRIVSSSVNLHHRQKPMSRNKTGVTGVSWSKQKRKWTAEIKWEKVRTHLGFFDKFEDAVAARKQKENELWSSLSR